MGIFGDSSSAPPKDALRQNKRMIDRAVREIDRERTRLKQEETKHAAELKKAAHEGHKVFFLQRSFFNFILSFLVSINHRLLALSSPKTLFVAARMRKECTACGQISMPFLFG